MSWCWAWPRHCARAGRGRSPASSSYYRSAGLVSTVLSLTGQTTEVHLLPSLNPDGYVSKTRNNANDRDLNRGFPDWGDLGPVKFGPAEEHK